MFAQSLLLLLMIYRFAKISAVRASLATGLLAAWAAAVLAGESVACPQLGQKYMLASWTLAPLMLPLPEVAGVIGMRWLSRALLQPNVFLASVFWVPCFMFRVLGSHSCSLQDNGLSLCWRPASLLPVCCAAVVLAGGAPRLVPSQPQGTAGAASCVGADTATQPS